jgi:hypothetical protein
MNSRLPQKNEISNITPEARAIRTRDSIELEDVTNEHRTIAGGPFESYHRAAP